MPIRSLAAVALLGIACTSNVDPVEDVSSEKFYGPGYEDCDRRVADVSRAERLLGWKAKVPLRETLLHTMSYFHDLYGKK